MDRFATVVGGAPRRVSGFEVGYVDHHGVQQRELLKNAVSYEFELAAPARIFRSWPGQRNNTGWWYFATTGKHVGFESWLERDHVMLLDHDPAVTGLASQPFWLFWPSHNRTRSHAPDYFARLADGTGMVIDCRPEGAVRRRDAEAFEATRQACEEVGWCYNLVHEPDLVYAANVWWLSGYRHPRYRNTPIEVAAREVFSPPRTLLSAAEELGEPLAAFPVLYHLLWTGELVADMARPLSEHTVVSAAVEGREA